MKNLFLLTAVVLLLASCGGDNQPTSTINPDGIFVAQHDYQLSADIDPTTMSQLLSENFGYDALSFPTEEFYSITSQGELDLFNQQLPVNEQISLPDLDSHSYFLTRSPACPNWFELAGVQPVNQAAGEFTMTVNEFTLTGVACPAVIEKIYSVCMAEKF